MRKISAIIASTLIFFSSAALALDTDLFRPQADNLGTFRLFGSKTLAPGVFSVGIFASYIKDPLILKVGGDKYSIVDRQYTFHLISEAGLHDRISIGFDVPLMNSRHSIVPSITDKQSNWSAGDIEVHGKFRLLKLEDYPVGITIVPFVEIPSGKPSYFTGDQGTDIGAKGVVDWQKGRVYLTANIGIRGHLKEDTVTATMGTNTSELKVGNEFTYGVGGRVDIIKDKLQGLIDIAGSTTLSDFAKHQGSSPAEIIAGGRYFFKDRLLGIHFGGGAGLDDGYGAPKYRIFGGLTTQFGVKGGTKKPVEKPVTPEKSAKIDPSGSRVIILRDVYFDTSKAIIKPESIKILNENVEMLKKNPDVRVRIEGHCDSRGSDEMNQKLSEQRANAVMKYFADHGIAKERMTAAGMGETKPLEPNDSPENMARNRRIELHLTYPADYKAIKS